MRALTTGRYNDQAFVYYSAEVRLQTHWQPRIPIPGLRNIAIGWVQLVPFVELGRVAPALDLEALHKDMKWDIGFDLRFWVPNSVVRAGWAWSEEDWSIKVMVSHPF